MSKQRTVYRRHLYLHTNVIPILFGGHWQSSSWTRRASKSFCSRQNSLQRKQRQCPSCLTSREISRRSSRLEKGCGPVHSHEHHRILPTSKRESPVKRGVLSSWQICQWDGYEMIKHGVVYIWWCGRGVLSVMEMYNTWTIFDLCIAMSSCDHALQILVVPKIGPFEYFLNHGLVATSCIVN